VPVRDDRQGLRLLHSARHSLRRDFRVRESRREERTLLPAIFSNTAQTAAVSSDGVFFVAAA
jgi:hypothetical protein